MPARKMSGEMQGKRLQVREAARVLKLMASEAVYVQPVRNEDDNSEWAAGVYQADGDGQAYLCKIPMGLLSSLFSMGWLDRDKQRYTLNDTGRAWLRRHLSGAEPFREQHELRESRLADVNGAVRPVVVNAAESPLGWLYRRKTKDGNALITAEQFNAGERLRQDFTFGQMTPSVTSRLDATASSSRKRRSAPVGAAGLSDDAMAARQRVEKALSTVGPELSGILLDVCCYLRGLEDTEKAHGWPRRSGKVILAMALNRLARHYGLLRGGSSAADGRSRVRHWGSQGYRPTLENWE